MGGLFTSLTNALSPFFLNPAIFIPGAALVLSPIIIHLLNRLRFRKVRFAAMEFLLQSQKRNKRRVLLEQLLLLLMRIFIVLLIAALIARLILDPSQLALLQGEKSHHLVLLDDGVSMQDRWGETNAFEQGKNVIRKLVEEGSRRPGTQKLTILLLSDPEQPYLNGEEINEQLLIKLTDDLDALRPTHQTFSLLDGLTAARTRLMDERAVSRTLHVISDYRESDWGTEPALAQAVQAFEEGEVAVNLVRAVTEAHDNLSLLDFTGELQSAAVNIPIQLTATVRNQSDQAVRNVRLTLEVDGRPLPYSAFIDRIEARETTVRPVEVTIATPGKHRVRVSLDADSLAPDNTRDLVVDLPDTNPVLLIDGRPAGDEAGLVADALAADPTLTGIEPLIQTPEFLRRADLNRFRCIYLINVQSLPADAVLPLENYVRSGGGLAWFLGNLTDVAFLRTLYNEDAPAEGLFPVPLGRTWADLPRSDEVNPGPDMIFADHPRFGFFHGAGSALISIVHIDRYFPVADEFDRKDESRDDGVKTIVSLKNRQPLIFEHKLGAGRVITCLTTAGPDWNDWPVTEPFVYFQLELQSYLAKRFQADDARTCGEPIELALDASVYAEEVEITGPDERVSRIRMTAAGSTASANDGDGSDGDGSNTENSDDSDEVLLRTRFADTDLPGVYRVTLFNHDNVPEERWTAFNPPAGEGDLALASDTDLKLRIGDNFALQSIDDLDWIQQRDAQQEVRLSLLAALFILLLLEQFFAYRLSYHSRRAGAVA